MASSTDGRVYLQTYSLIRTEMIEAEQSHLHANTNKFMQPQEVKKERIEPSVASNVDNKTLSAAGKLQILIINNVRLKYSENISCFAFFLRHLKPSSTAGTYEASQTWGRAQHFKSTFFYQAKGEIPEHKKGTSLFIA